MPAVPAFEITVEKDYKQTTVRQLLKAIKAWCKQPAADSGRPDVQCTNAELYFDENTEFQGLQFVEDDEDPYGHNYIMKVSL